VCEGLLFAFHKPDCRFDIVPRVGVEEVVRSELNKLRTVPFVWLVAANFVTDAEELPLAKIETGKLLYPSDGSEEIEGTGVGGPG